jgi:hypothetical protein
LCFIRMFTIKLCSIYCRNISERMEEVGAPIANPRV